MLPPSSTASSFCDDDWKCHNGEYKYDIQALLQVVFDDDGWKCHDGENGEYKYNQCYLQALLQVIFWWSINANGDDWNVVTVRIVNIKMDMN